MASASLKQSTQVGSQYVVADEASRSSSRQRSSLSVPVSRASSRRGSDPAPTQPSVKRHNSADNIGSPAAVSNRRRNSAPAILARSTPDSSHQDKNFASERHIGLPSFEESGYFMTRTQSKDWPDQRLFRRLRLQIAVHATSRTQRICFCQPKRRLPAGVKNGQILAMARKLKSCDHVNIVRCHEVFEDRDSLYFLYENVSCVSFYSVMDKQTWTEEQIVNFARELCAAFAYAASSGLHHLGVTPNHIFLPRGSANKDPKIAKIFGLGLMGTIDIDVADRMCWAPEAVEKYNQDGDNFASKFQQSEKRLCDLWSLGTLIYCAVSRRPFIAGAQHQLQSRLSYLDREASALIEAFLQPKPSRRLSALEGLQSTWIHRRWHPSPHGGKTFQRFVAFCTAPLPTRLFGRFLVKFLNAEQRHEISLAYYSLDQSGDGLVGRNDLESIAREIRGDQSAVDAIISWMCSDGSSSISLSRFAESMAENIIDGTALRAAFESLDNDGSEAISAEELFEAMQHLHKDLTLEQVVRHIKCFELDNSDKENAPANGKIEFQEFARLFPERCRRLQGLQDRLAATHLCGEQLGERLDGVKDEVNKWIKALEEKHKEVGQMCPALLEKQRKHWPKNARDEESIKAISDLQGHASDILKYLAHPPGTHREPTAPLQDNTKVVNGSYDFDTFVRDRAHKAHWTSLIKHDRQKLRSLVIHDERLGTSVDRPGAYQAASNIVNKLDKVLGWTKSQLEEYESIVEVLKTIEAPIPEVALSKRGLHYCKEEVLEEEANVQEDEISYSCSLWSAPFVGLLPVFVKCTMDGISDARRQ